MWNRSVTASIRLGGPQVRLAQKAGVSRESLNDAHVVERSARRKMRNRATHSVMLHRTRGAKRLHRLLSSCSCLNVLLDVIEQFRRPVYKRQGPNPTRLLRSDPHPRRACAGLFKPYRNRLTPIHHVRLPAALEIMLPYAVFKDIQIKALKSAARRFLHLIKRSIIRTGQRVGISLWCSRTG